MFDPPSTSQPRRTINNFKLNFNHARGYLRTFRKYVWTIAIINNRTKSTVGPWDRYDLHVRQQIAYFYGVSVIIVIFFFLSPVANAISLTETGNAPWNRDTRVDNLRTVHFSFYVLKSFRLEWLHDFLGSRISHEFRCNSIQPSYLDLP